MVASRLATDPVHGDARAMTKIILFAVGAIVLMFVTGAITQSSVGGPLTIMLILFIAMLAVAVHEALSNNRGPLGWIVNIVVTVIGGFLAAMFVGMGMEAIIPYLRIDGSLASSGHPFLYVAAAAMTIVTLLGSWAVLQLINRFR